MLLKTSFNHTSYLWISLAITAVLLSAIPVQTYANQTLGEVEVFATVPTPPGFPEGIAVQDGIVYIAGPAAPQTAGNATPSGVVAFDLATGELIQTYDTQGEDLDAEHANTCIAFDNASRLYVLNSQLGIYRIDIESGEQETYAAAIPDIPTCLFSKKDESCSPGLRNRFPMANDIAFDAHGNAYITDSLQATIWKVPAGGGAPEVWFQDFLLNSFIFGFVGVNGLRLDPTGTMVYITVTSNPRNQGIIYTLPLTQNPGSEDLSEFHVFDKGETPDGIAFGASGRLYTVINGDNTKIIVLNPDGTEYSRIESDLFRSSANAAFDGEGSLLVVNHPISDGREDPSLFKVLKMFVDDIAAPLIRPDLP